MIKMIIEYIFVIIYGLICFGVGFGLGYGKGRYDKITKYVEGLKEFN